MNQVIANEVFYEESFFREETPIYRVG